MNALMPGGPLLLSKGELWRQMVSVKSKYVYSEIFFSSNNLPPFLFKMIWDVLLLCSVAW